MWAEVESTAEAGRAELAKESWVAFREEMQRHLPSRAVQDGEDEENEATVNGRVPRRGANRRDLATIEGARDRPDTDHVSSRPATTQGV